ncbi:MAG: sulfurtransferase complex subunit TusB [Rhodospirillales bacterium]|nr:sulfurtransferase complex subunit TusB [Rhodospirillales bacterium]
MIHTVNKSPYERNAFDSCLKHAVKGSAILLYEDGVYAAVKGCTAAARLADAVADHPVFVLGPDLKARGMDPANVVDGVRVVDYGDFVDLVVEHGTVQAWL